MVPPAATEQATKVSPAVRAALQDDNQGIYSIPIDNGNPIAKAAAVRSGDRPK